MVRTMNAKAAAPRDNPRHPLVRAIKELQGATNLARAIGYTPQEVNCWLDGVRPIPHNAAALIENASGIHGIAERLRGGARYIRQPVPAEVRFPLVVEFAFHVEPKKAARS
jgi:DNA-binding transcriptional regulator YdaS (Cro superfamily)